MKVLILNTPRMDLRSEVEGWSIEDSSMYVPNKHIGMTPSPMSDAHMTTVLQALYEGWKLLSPPQEIVEKEYTEYVWWLTKDPASNLLEEAARYLSRVRCSECKRLFTEPSTEVEDPFCHNDHRIISSLLRKVGSGNI